MTVYLSEIKYKATQENHFVRICNQWVAGSTPVTSSTNERTNDGFESFVRFLFAEKVSETACAAAAGGQI